MVVVKILMVGAAIAILMAVARDQRWAERAGVTGRCVTVQSSTRPGGTWYLCQQGILTGFPSLESEQCTSAGLVAHKELWQCQGPLVSLPSY